MAFWLVDQGYDVWVTNIRANFEAGHTEYPRSDPRFWAWGLKELAFDLRDIVEFICGATGKPRVAYVGHSQGSGSMYLALSPGICPELGRRLSSFTAIGPSGKSLSLRRVRFRRLTDVYSTLPRPCFSPLRPNVGQSMPVPCFASSLSA